MSEQILKIKLQADASGIVSVVKETGTLAKEMSALEKATIKVETAWEALSKKIESGNALIAKGINNQGLALYNTKKAAEEYKASLAALQDIKFATTLGINPENVRIRSAVRPEGAFSYATGAAIQGLSPTEKLNLAEEKASAERRAFLNKRDREEKAAADEFIANEELVTRKLQETNARRVKAAEEREQTLLKIRQDAVNAQKQLDAQYTAFQVSKLTEAEEEGRGKQLQSLKEHIRAKYERIAEAEKEAEDLRKKAIASELVSYKEGTSQSLQELNNRVNLEAAVRRFGVDSQQAIAVRASIEEQRIRKDLATKLADIEKQVASGAITNVQAQTQVKTATDSATQAIINNSKALDDNNKVVDRSKQQHKSLLTHIVEVYGAYQVLNTVTSGIKQLLADIPSAGIAQQQAIASVTAIFGTKQGEENLRFLRELAGESGQYIKDLQDAYTRFAPSAMLAGAKQEEVNKIFEDFTKVSTVLHFSTDQVKSLYLALEQMYAKTTVQSEEIKKQLGNVLPGAVEIGAKAWAKYTNSADKSVAAFMDAMKKNLVITKQFAPAFAAEYREVFGGANDTIFKDVATKLQSNLQRVRNEYFYLTTDLFNVTADSMNKTVKIAAEGLVSIRENLGGILQVVEALSVLLAGNLLASFAKFIATAEGLAKVVSLTQRVFNPLTLGVTAAVAGVTALATATTDMEVRYEKFTFASKEQIASLMKTYAAQKEGAKEAGEELQRLTETSKSFSINYEGMQISTSSLFSALGDMLGEWFDELKTRVSNFWELFKELAAGTLDYVGAYFKSILPYSTREALGEMKTGFIEFGEWVNNTVIKPIAEDLAIAFDVVLQRAKAAQEKANLELQANKPTVFPGMTPPPNGGEGGAGSEKDRARAIKEAYRAALEEVRAAFQTVRGDIAEALGNIDNLFKQNAMSIADYFTQKKSLQLVDLEVQKEMLNQELQLAFAQKDKVKIAKLNTEIAKAETAYRKEISKTIQEQTAAEREYYALMLNTEAKVLALQGRAGEAAAQQFDIANRATKERFTAEGNTEGLNNLKILREDARLTGALADQTEQRTRAETEYQNAIERTNIMKNIGSIGEFDALVRNTELNNKYIAQQEKMIAQAQKEIDISREQTGVVDVKKLDNLEAMRIKLENFKLTADEVSMHFEKVFGDAFSNAFVGFANGTMTAKQAFSSMVTSMISEIQRLVAKEAASALLSGILKPLFGMAVSNVAGMFGPSTLAGNSAGFVDTMSKSGTSFWGAGATKLIANGDVMSGAGISAYSNSIVTKPTVFPFANGVGLMGEAGAEAILPLRRNAQGKLGVLSSGNGGLVQNSGNQYNVTVHVEGGKNDSPSDMGGKIGEAIIRSLAKDEIYKAQRTGNILNRTTKFA